MSVVGSTSLAVDMEMMANAAPFLIVVRSSPALQAIFLVDAAKSPVNGEAHSTWLRDTLIAKFVHLYLDGCDRLEWNSDAFDQAAVNLRTFLDAPRLQLWSWKRDCVALILRSGTGCRHP